MKPNSLRSGFLPPLDGRDHHRYKRSKPAIYLHQLARYVDASPDERRALVAAAKYPRPGRADVETSRTIGRLMTMGWRQDLYSSFELQKWWCVAEPRDPVVDQRRVEARLALELIDRFLDRLNGELVVRGSRRRLEYPTPMSMTLGGVAIIDAPAMLTEIQQYGRAVDVGCVSLALSEAHTRESSGRAAVLLWRLVRACRGRRRSLLARRLCVVADVDTHQLGDARGGYERRLAELEAACTEIASMWSAA